MEIVPGNPDGSLADPVRPKLLAIKVSGCHLVLVISGASAVVRPANHQDLVTIAHLIGRNTARRRAQAGFLRGIHVTKGKSR
jgi:hypothetical protein